MSADMIPPPDGSGGVPGTHHSFAEGDSSRSQNGSSGQDGPGRGMRAGDGRSGVPRSLPFGFAPQFVSKHENYRHYYYYIQDRFTTDRKPVEELQMAIRDVEEEEKRNDPKQKGGQSLSSPVTAEESANGDQYGSLIQRNYFLRIALPKWVSSLLGRSSRFYQDEEMVTLVSTFFQAAMKLAILMIDHNVEEQVLVLCRIFTCTRIPFYARPQGDEDRSVLGSFRNSREKERERSLKEMMESMVKVRDDAHQLQRFSSLSVLRRKNSDCEKYALHYFAHLNYFGYIGGFDAIMQRVRKLPLQRKQVDGGGRGGSSDNTASEITTPAAAADAATVDAGRKGTEKEKKEDSGGGVDMTMSQLPEISFIRMLSKCLFLMHSMLNRKFLDTFLVEYTELIFDHLLYCTRTVMRADERTAFHDTSRYLQKLLRSVVSSDEINLRINRFNLNLGLQNFGEGTLDKQLKGVKLIRKNVIRCLKAKEERNRGLFSRLAGGREDTKEDQQAIHPKILLEWMQNNRVVEHLFHSTAHPEMIRQGIQIPLFLAMHDGLEREHLDMLWDTALGQHESVKEIIYDAVVDLLPHISMEDVQHLYSRLQSLPLKTYTLQEVKFVHRFGRTANHKAEGQVFFSYHELWGCFQDEAPTGEKVRQAAFDNLVDLLQGSHAGSRLGVFTTLCIQNLNAKKTVFQSLKLLIRIIAAHKKKKRAKFIQSMERDHSILNVIFRSLHNTHNDSAKQITNCGEKSYLKEIRAHFEFLDVILRLSALTVSASQLDGAWQWLVSQSSLPEEREILFDWLENASTGTSRASFTAFDDNVMQHLFVKKMCNMDCTVIQVSGFHLYNRYFLSYNEKRGLIKRISAGKSDTEVCYIAVSSELVGVEKMWQMALFAHDPEVSRLATQALNRIHENVCAESMKPRVGKVRLEYVSTAMRKLAEEMKRVQDGKSSSSVNLHVHRCLMLLKSFVCSFSSPQGSHAVVNRGLELFLRSEHNEGFVLHVQPEDTIQALRNQIAELIQKPANALILSTLGPDQRELSAKLGDQTLSEFGLRPRETLHVRTPAPSRSSNDGRGSSSNHGGDRNEDMLIEHIPLNYVMAQSVQFALRSVGLRGAPANSFSKRHFGTGAVAARSVAGGMGRDQGSESLSAFDPSAMLSNDAHFDRLYGLLDHPQNQIGEEVWALLEMLPENRRRLSQVRALQVNVSELLDRTCLFRLAYSLRLIRSVLLQSKQHLAGTSHSIPAAAAGAGGSGGGVTTTTTPGAATSHHGSTAGNTSSSSSQTTDGGHQVNGAAWQQKFIAEGGVQRLLDVLRELDATSLSDAQASAYAFLLEVVNMFVVEECQEDEGAEKVRIREGVLSSSSTTKLMNTLLALSLHAAGPFASEDHTKDEKTLSDHEVEERGEESDGASSSVSSKISLSTSSVDSQSTDAAKRMNQAKRDVHHQAEEDENKDSMSSEGRDDVVAHSLRLLVACAVSDKGAHVLVYKELDRWLLSVTLQCLRRRARAAACRQVLKLSEISPQVHQHLLGVLLQALPTIEEHQDTCAEYFSLLERLLASAPLDSSETPAGGSEDWQSMLEKLYEQIYSHPVVEPAFPAVDRKPGMPSPVVDRALVGILNLVRAILRRLPKLKSNKVLCKKLIACLFDDCLFTLPTPQHTGLAPPKCKTRPSRVAAFGLITELCRDAPRNYRIVLNRLNDQLQAALKTPARGSVWQYQGMGARSAANYVGLQNLGATCYMNSLMQQLFMTPPLRMGLLTAKLPPMSAEEREGNILFQVQKMFASLQESAKRYYETAQFALAVKGYDGQPMNPRVQMDAKEFLDILFDRLESELKKSGRDGLLEAVFGGSIDNQLISKETGRSRGRPEPFYTLSLDVKNKKNINEALQLFVTGEPVDAAEDGVGDKLVPHTKRQVVESLPPVLLIHLKRFEFRFDIMDRIKLNSRCEFYEELDLLPYTTEGVARSDAGVRLDSTDASFPPLRDRDYYRYRLVGFVVHTGTINAGHYYSFIRERPGLESGTVSGNGDTTATTTTTTTSTPAGTSSSAWFQYNDTTVTAFDPKDTAYHAFGGFEKVRRIDPKTGKEHIVEHERGHNAYILVYERIKCKVPLEDLFDDLRGFQASQETKQGEEDEEDEDDVSIAPVLDEPLDDDDDNDDEISSHPEKTTSVPLDSNEIKLSDSADSNAVDQEPAKKGNIKSQDSSSSLLTPTTTQVTTPRKESSSEEEDAATKSSSTSSKKSSSGARKSRSRHRSSSSEKQSSGRKSRSRSKHRSSRSPGAHRSKSPKEGKESGDKSPREASSPGVSPRGGSSRRGCSPGAHRLRHAEQTAAAKATAKESAKKAKDEKKGRKEKEKSKKKENSKPLASSAPALVVPASLRESLIVLPGQDMSTAVSASGRAPVPIDLLQELWAENEAFYKDRYLYNSDYFNLVWSVASTLQVENYGKYSSKDYCVQEVTVQYLLQLFLHVFTRSRERPMFSSWVKLICGLLHDQPASCRWILGTLCQNQALMRKLLLNCPVNSIRNAFVDILNEAMRTLAPLERKHYTEELLVLSRTKEDEIVVEHHSYIIWLLFSLQRMMKNHVPRRSSSTKQFFRVFSEFASIGWAERAYLLANGYVKMFIDFFLQRGQFTSVTVLPAGYTGGAGTGNGPPPSSHLEYLVEVIYLLVCSCDTDSAAGPSSPPTTLSGDVLHLDALDREALFSSSLFFRRVLHEDVNTDALVAIACHWSWNSKMHSKFFLNILRADISRVGSRDPSHYLRLLIALQELRDSYAYWRLDAALMGVLRVAANSAVSRDLRAHIEGFLKSWAEDNQQVNEWVHKNSDMVQQVHDSIHFVESRRPF